VDFGKLARPLTVGAVIVLLGCSAPPSSSSQTSASQPAPRPAAEKRLVTAIFGDPKNLGTNRTSPGGALQNVPGGEAVEELLQVGLSTIDEKGALQARLAEAVPSFENGLWKVTPDGHMETTWKIKENARWHDGAAFTSDDLLFTAQVYQDKDTGIFPNTNIDLIQRVEAPDRRTITVTWSQPFIEADSLFTAVLALPMPKHLLEKAFAEDKTRVMEQPYWTDDFVGTGAYKLRAWAPGSHVALEAFDGYTMGRPKIDQVEIKFIYDANALIASVASGVVDLTMGRGLDIEQALSVPKQRTDVEPVYASAGWVPIYPQFLNTTPAIVGDARMRRALLHAIDRQELADTVAHGLVPVAHTFVSPEEAMYKGVESSIVKYDYDPRRSTQLIDELGYSRGSDGMYRDTTNQPLSIELWTTAQRDHHLKSIFPVADNWQRVGVAVEANVVPIQRVPDREYLFQFPAFILIGLGNGLRSADVKRYHSTFAGTAENRYQLSGNMARYANADFDTLIDKYITTIPMPERTKVLADIVRQQTDQVTVMGLFYQLRPVIRAQKLLNITAGHQTGSPAWNAHTWDVR